MNWLWVRIKSPRTTCTSKGKCFILPMITKEAILRLSNILECKKMRQIGKGNSMNDQRLKFENLIHFCIHTNTKIFICFNGYKIYPISKLKKIRLKFWFEYGYRKLFN